MGKTTISYIVKETCMLIWRKLRQLYMPIPDRAQWEDIGQKFWSKCRFPNCLGAVDGKHIQLVMPLHTGSKFYNYKKYFSIVLMAVADAEYKFVYIDVGAFGSASDSQIFRNTTLFQRLEDGQLDLPPPTPWPGTSTECFPYTFIGDEAFALSKNLMRPCSSKDLNDRKTNFNNRLSKARRMVECSFGILSNKWRVLHTPINLNVDTAVAAVKATCILHNFVVKQEGVAADEDHVQHVQPLRGLSWTEGRNTNEAIANRDLMSQYFLSMAGQ
ncbi:uncharacterized protein [Hyperolius riggenbachi]|uniref:uncharacterized protein n=1 Tax=Hyperolius riggenbachi TaxID=752182 RepID=UPI0035A3A984